MQYFVVSLYQADNLASYHTTVSSGNERRATGAAYPIPIIPEIPSQQQLDDVSQRIIPDMPSGPLDVYRHKSSFNWKKLKYILEGKDSLLLEQKFWTFLQEDPIFRPINGDASLDEIRKITFMRTKRLIEYRRLLTPDASLMDYRAYCVMPRCLGTVDWSAYVKMTLSEMAFRTTLVTIGSERHLPILQQQEENRVVACLVITELSHGSNLKGLQTTATYDPTTQEFVINSPNIEAAKCWVGSLGKHANWGLLYAQLYTPDQKFHGLHVFAIPLRDPKTNRPFPGIIIGDMGPKVGLQGIDNGFMMFHNYRVPHFCLLNKNGDVTLDGKYVSNIKNESQRFSSSLGALSGGRVGIIRICAVNMMKSLAIAVRYAAVRKQFGSKANEEFPVLEYQLQQSRLIPHIAIMYALDTFSKHFFHQFINFNTQVILSRVEDKAETSAEMHAMASAVKPLASWLARDAIQDCREACGGHGYLKISGLGDIRGDHDANMTYEGECNVLLQQTSNYLLQLLKSKRAGEKILSPCGVLDFFNDFGQILKSTLMVFNKDDILPVEITLNAYKWLICYLTQEGDRKFQEQIRAGSDPFTAKNNSQVYYLKTLSLAFGEYIVLLRFYELSHHSSLPTEISTVLRRLCSLYGLYSLEKHLGTLYEGGYISGPNVTKFIRHAILNLCEELKDDAVALVDVFAPPDLVLNSPLGASDGHVYKHLYSAMVHRQGAFDQPSWWKELENFPSQIPAEILSKL
ncbi:acyl-Coenzyme A oxidase [Chamberlinius hualienensis]